MSDFFLKTLWDFWSKLARSLICQNPTHDRLVKFEYTPWNLTDKYHLNDGPRMARISGFKWAAIKAFVTFNNTSSLIGILILSSTVIQKKPAITVIPFHRNNRGPLFSQRLNGMPSFWVLLQPLRLDHERATFLKLPGKNCLAFHEILVVWKMTGSQKIPGLRIIPKNP